jgi:uncharacterized membrane protein YfcA
MPELSVLFLAACMFLGAALYTSVGHAGASAYIALMALFGIPPAVMRPTALALYILVASFTSFRYLRAGMFRWRVWPFLLGAVPFAVLGGAIQLPGAYYRPLVGVVLLIGGARLKKRRRLVGYQLPREMRGYSFTLPFRLLVVGGGQALQYGNAFAIGRESVR